MKKLLMVIAVCLISAIMFTGCKEFYSEGERVGTVIKFSKAGLIWDSWDGLLNLTQTGMNSAGEPFCFSFDNDRNDQDSLVNLVIDAQRYGWKIKIVYHECLGWNWFFNRGECNYFVEDVIVLDKSFSKPLENITRDTEPQKIDNLPYNIGTKENPLYIVIVNE